MLFRRYKDGAPVPRSELNKLVAAKYKERRKLAPYVVACAQQRFLSSLGVEMRSLEKLKAGRNEQVLDAKKLVKSVVKADAKGQELFVLRSALPAAVRAAVVDLPSDSPRRGLAAVLLSILSLSGEAGLPEDSLWAALAPLGVDRKAKRHPALGHVEDAVASLVKQRVVLRGKGAPGGAHADVFVYEIGDNGADEVPPKRVAQLVASMLGGGGGGAGGGAAADAGAGAGAGRASGGGAAATANGNAAKNNGKGKKRAATPPPPTQDDDDDDDD